MSKKIVANVDLQVPAGKANPSPPVGPALGKFGINIMSFCNDFNAKTKDLELGTPVPVSVTIFADRTFTFVIQALPASVLIKQMAGISKGSAKAKADKVGKLTRAQVELIVEKKKQDLTARTMEAAVATIIGTARSVGVEVSD